MSQMSCNVVVTLSPSWITGWHKPDTTDDTTDPECGHVTLDQHTWRSLDMTAPVWHDTSWTQYDMMMLSWYHCPQSLSHMSIKV